MVIYTYFVMYTTQWDVQYKIIIISNFSKKNRKNFYALGDATFTYHTHYLFTSCVCAWRAS